MEIRDVRIIIPTLTSPPAPQTALPPPPLSLAFVTRPDHVTEALFLYIMAAVGCFLNAVVAVSIVAIESLRRTSGGAFLLHGSLLDLVRCAYCVPFASSILWETGPRACATLGTSYFLVVTASGFNIVATVCGEAFSLSELGPPTTTTTPISRPSPSPTPGGSNTCCVAFGVAMVYACSVIIHLGPTIIGGDFDPDVVVTENCIFVHGTVKSYIVHVMWIVIMTLTMTSVLFYLGSLHRNARAARRRTTTTTTDLAGNHHRKLRHALRHSLSRSMVLIAVTVAFLVCWYPLYVLTLFDPRIRQPAKVYKLLTFVACSNAFLNPVIMLLFDSQMSVFRRLLRRRRRPGRGGGSARAVGPCADRPSRRVAAVRSGVAIPRCGGRGVRGVRVGVGVGGAAAAAQSASKSAENRKPDHRVPETLYDRVGCRLYREGIATTSGGRAGGGEEGTWQMVWMKNGSTAVAAVDDDACVCDRRSPYSSWGKRPLDGGQ